LAVVKYKIHELAKDFDLKSKKVIDLLTPYSEGEKKSQTSLTADELDIVFDVLTQENSVSSFEAYFAMKKPETKAEDSPAPARTPAAETPALVQAENRESRLGHVVPPLRLLPQMGTPSPPVRKHSKTLI
jgi:translation initiation factor IF-2